MMNSLCGSMGSIKSENSCSKIQQTTSNDSSSISDQSKKKTTTPQTSDLEQSSSNLLPSNLDFSSLKFDLDGDVEVQSPDNSLWECLLSDQFDQPDFMILSPVRNFPSPKSSNNYNYNYNYNYGQAIQGQSSALAGCSPPRSSSQHLGAAFSNILHKGKGLSPLHKVYNSPNNQSMQTENLALPAIEDLLNDYQRDEFGAFSTRKMPISSSIYNTQSSYEIPNTIPTSLTDYMSLPNSSLRFCGSMNELLTSSAAPVCSQLIQDQNVAVVSATDNQLLSGAPLSQQLQQERHQEQKQQIQLHQQHNQNLTHSFPISSDQVKISYSVIMICSPHPTNSLNFLKHW